jgi:DNA-binding transcriptional LysR family regulator
LVDRLDELSVFLAIIDAGSLSGAARRLRRSPPFVTRTLASLEARLGETLLQRTTRRLIITESGRRFSADARRALAAYADALRQDVDAAPRGVLRITAPLIFGRRHVTPVVASFLNAFPAMQAELTLADRYLDLIEEGLDAALRIGPPDETLPAPQRLGEVRRIVIASPAYLATRGEP